MIRFRGQSMCSFALVLSLMSLTPPSGARAAFVNWLQVAGCAKVIAANEGAFLNIWAIGRGGGDQQVYQWDQSVGWLPHPFVWANRIALPETQSGGLPWVVDASGRIFAFDGSTWLAKPGCARELVFDADKQTVWVIGCTRVGSDYSIHRLRPGSSQWERMPSSATGIGRMSNFIAITNSAGKLSVWNDNARRFEQQSLPSGFNRAELRGTSTAILTNTSPARREIWQWVVTGWARQSPNTPNADVIWSTRDFAVNGNCQIFFREHNDAS